MRRPYAVLLVLALYGAGASLAALGMPFVRTALRATPGLRHLTDLHLMCPGVVAAAENLRFRPLPAESAAAMARHRARTAASAVPAAPPPPAAPESPEAPSAPESPRIVKSGDVMRVGSDIHVGRDEVVTGSVSAIGGDVTVDGHVEGDVSAIRGDVYLSPTARVDGDVVSAGGQIHEEPGAYVGGQRVTAMPGTRRAKRLQRYMEHDTVEHVGHVTGALVWFLVLLGVSWAIVQLAPARTAAAVDTLRRGTIPSFGIGALILALIIPSLVALSLLVGFLCITIIGIPLALAALLAYGLFFAAFGIWGFVVGAGALGGVILQRRAASSAAPAPPATISRAVLSGVILVAGSLVLGSIFGAPGMFVPFRVLGGFLFVITIIVMGLSSLAGGGAWVRSEFQTGRFGRWWQGRKAASAPPAATSAPPPPPSPPPPAPPSPPSAFAPPATDPGTAPPAG